jgi:hypothetical protein
MRTADQAADGLSSLRGCCSASSAANRSSKVRNDPTAASYSAMRLRYGLPLVHGGWSPSAGSRRMAGTARAIRMMRSWAVPVSQRVG